MLFAIPCPLAAFCDRQARRQTSDYLDVVEYEVARDRQSVREHRRVLQDRHRVEFLQCHCIENAVLNQRSAPGQYLTGPVEHRGFGNREIDSRHLRDLVSDGLVVAEPLLVCKSQCIEG